MNKFDFFYPRSRYRGEFIPEHIAFNLHLQYFAHQVSLLCGLQTNGKVAPSDAYHRLVELWQQFEEYTALNLGDLNSHQSTLDQIEIEEV
ncbi:DUF7219 family protein [Chroogloeocystis siderophila]|jgi:hypothetical protein|uniref:Uncharacterized protein n=1 Tax=Chroogloeocystis siderophila 5.2 s.c.1 TaxID=247279 RepID=A0A1U7HYF9_9CHRO|nr:hypothetical protein [Chroogloeocystis siderophila]OKH28685.1 hypothetical protein NIES1031_01855 [Chroogloeocystis siderophila 5.2 s.c.1]